ncbi:MAG: BT4734/BF3469 family protein [Balneolales bacterium]
MNFKTNISFFETFDSEPETITLAEWLKRCKEGRFKSVIEAYRKSGDAELKKSLPLVTVGAVCEGGRGRDNVVNRTGWIALDIDAKENPYDAETLRDELKKIAFVAFAGLSASGNGVWALVKVSNADKQEKHFEQLKTDFASIGITLDSTKGKNPNDARFYSYDPGAWVRNMFKIYNRLPVPKRITHKSYSGDTRSKVETLVEKIQSERIDITHGYKNWLKIGFALSDEFGESGRDLFHAVSQYHSEYNQTETDRQFTKCVRAGGEGVTISSFFHICRENEIELKTAIPNHSKAGDRALETNSRSQNSAPYGKNPWTGEIFDSRGYPSDWDDPMLTKIVKTFDCQLEQTMN